MRLALDDDDAAASGAGQVPCDAGAHDAAADDHYIRRVHICHHSDLTTMFWRSVAVSILLTGLAPAAPDPPPFSLNDDALPRKYTIELTVDPDRDFFQGVARIEIELLKRLPVIWLNATGLTVSEATPQAGGRALPVRATADGGDLLAIEPDPPGGAFF